MLSIHNNNLSASTQNVAGAYVINMLVYRCLLTMRLHGKVAVSYQITLKKQQKPFVKGYVIISRASQVLCDVISRNRLSSLLVRFTPC